MGLVRLRRLVIARQIFMWVARSCSICRNIPRTRSLQGPKHGRRVSLWVSGCRAPERSWWVHRSMPQPPTFWATDCQRHVITDFFIGRKPATAYLCARVFESLIGSSSQPLHGTPGVAQSCTGMCNVTVSGAPRRESYLAGADHMLAPLEVLCFVCSRVRVRRGGVQGHSARQTSRLRLRLG